MTSRVKRIIVCRPGARRSDGHLSRMGQKQSRLLGEALKGSVGQSIACIVTSTLQRAVQTGETVMHYSFPGISMHSDSDLDEQRFGQHESDWALCVRIQRALGRLIQIQGDVVVVTHSGWIYACFRLMGLLAPGTPFSPVALASMHPLMVPVFDGGQVGPALKGWVCETSLSYACALMYEIPRNVSLVSYKWRERPSKTFGASKVVLETSNWIVKTDVWNMDKHRADYLFKGDIEPLMAISIHNGQPLACMRDIRPEHLESLFEIDSLYPDEEWIKFILYPPWVYRLHIHIIRKDIASVSLPCRNVHMLKDVISLVQEGVTIDGCMLVYRF